MVIVACAKWRTRSSEKSLLNMGGYRRRCWKSFLFYVKCRTHLCTRIFPGATSLAHTRFLIVPQCSPLFALPTTKTGKTRTHTAKFESDSLWTSVRHITLFLPLYLPFNGRRGGGERQRFEINRLDLKREKRSSLF